MTRSLNLGRFALLILGSLLVGVVILFIGRRPRPLPISWIEVGAALGIFVTVYVGLWAKRKNRISWSLLLVLAGNVICFSSILLPLSATVGSWVLNIGASFYVLAFLLRFLKLVRLATRKRRPDGT